MKLGYCPEGNGSSIFPFNLVFDESQDISGKQGFAGVDAVVFWGGTDVHPALYGGKPGKHSQVKHYPSPTRRDLFEWKAMQFCKASGIPMIGVCRGAQMMSAFAGGSIIQHVDNHVGGEHSITTHDGKQFPVTSCHHQMMYPFDIDHELLAWATVKLSPRFLNGEDKPIPQMEQNVEPEACYFPKIKGIAIQGHPEWMSKSDEVVHWFNNQIKEKLF